MAVSPSRRNTNKGSQKGEEIIEFSMRNDGMGRSGLAAADGEFIAGSQSLQVAVELGFPVREVHTNGQEYIALIRDDIPSARHPTAVRLGVADNVSTLHGHSWDAPVLHEIEQEVDFGPIIFPSEIQDVMDEYDRERAQEEKEAEADPEPVKTPEWGSIMARVPITLKQRWDDLVARQQGENRAEKIAMVIEKAERYEDLASS